MNLRFEFGQYLNPNLLRGSGSGILLNLNPEPQVWNWVWKVQELDRSQSSDQESRWMIGRGEWMQRDAGRSGQTQRGGQ